MDRRTFLASSGVVTAATLAGCSVPMTSTRLTEPTVQTEDDETHLIYRDDDGRMAVTSLLYGPVTDRGLIRMRLSVWHRDGTTVDDLDVTVRSRDPPTMAPEIYLAAPTAEFPPVHFSRDQQGRTFSVPEISDVGTGTVSIDWFLRSFDDDWPVELAIDVAYALEGSVLSRFAVDGTIDISLDRPNVTVADGET